MGRGTFETESKWKCGTRIMHNKCPKISIFFDLIQGQTTQYMIRNQRPPNNVWLSAIWCLHSKYLAIPEDLCWTSIKCFFFVEYSIQVDLRQKQSQSRRRSPATVCSCLRGQGYLGSSIQWLVKDWILLFKNTCVLLNDLEILDPSFFPSFYS